MENNVDVVILRKSNSTNQYETPDFNLASYLSTIGHKLISTKSVNQRFVFVFQNSEKLREDILNYWNHSALVDPLNFGQTLRNFKSMVRNESMKE